MALETASHRKPVYCTERLLEFYICFRWQPVFSLRGMFSHSSWTSTPVYHQARQ